MRRTLRSAAALAVIAGQLALSAAPAAAFCGFYVAKADTKLFNRASKVVLAWEGGKTTITMANDYEGDPKEFAVVVPVPSFIARDQIAIGEMAPIDHLDAYTAPRLVEYHDPDPCAFQLNMARAAPMSAASGIGAIRGGKDARGVTVEATYAVGEYDIAILSASESDGLALWLTENGYRIPAGAEAVLGSYIKQKMRFFLAKVDVERQAGMGQKFLRPLRVSYASPKFMLPIRLGTVNADGPQDLVIFALTQKGRVETTNYRTVKLPTGMDVPLYTKDEFGRFYKAMFDRAVSREEMSAVFLEYAWDMSWCDPCAADPLSGEEMQKLGASWVAGDRQGARSGRSGGAADAFVTRLHVRYDAAHFPEDLMLNETRDRENFQGRYVLRHPFAGEARCTAGARYRDALPARFETEATTLAALTGWEMPEIRSRMASSGQALQAGDNPVESFLRRFFGGK
jgi:hypothetical protein